MGRMPLHTRMASALLAAALGTAQPAHAQTYGFDWATIGDPGNRARSRRKPRTGPT